MRKPRLLDLFCGAGGAAKGYQRAGFYVVGVDIKAQPRYCGDEFYQADALTYPLEGFDAYHASPPCQGYSRMRHLPWLKDRKYPMLIDSVREQLKSTGKPWIIENVMDAHLPAGWLCGTMFGLPFYRHRSFETPFFWLQPGHGKHEFVISPGRYFCDAGDKANERESPCWPWMTKMEQRQAIPPAYTEYIGKYLIQYLETLEKQVIRGEVNCEPVEPDGRGNSKGGEG